MCYDVSSGLMALIKYAKHRHDGVEEIATLEKQLEIWQHQIKAHHVVSGFAHPKLLVFTNKAPMLPQAFTWGLIPFWVKDAQSAKTIANQTLNARAESIFEKPSYRAAAKSKRCIIYLDAFYEHYHYKGKTYPFHIAMKDAFPLVVAGLWEDWTDKANGDIMQTVSIVTCPPNEMMQKIHNNPKLEAPRMPVILPRELQDKWLQECNTAQDQKDLLALCVPLQTELLSYFTVRKIKGKEAVGDIALAEEVYTYDELPSLL